MRELPHRRKMYILAGVLLAMLLGALDATIVGPAMPNIVRDLGGMAMLAWVFTIYSLTSTITIPIVGKLSDLYGRKWFYIGGISLFLAGLGAVGRSRRTHLQLAVQRRSVRPTRCCSSSSSEASKASVAA